jgi:hypothetical protein
MNAINELIPVKYPRALPSPTGNANSVENS